MAEYGRTVTQEVQRLTAKVKTLLNADLKEICRGESLQVSGVKATLQKRIIDRLESCARSGATARVADLAYRIDHGGQSPPPKSTAVASNSQQLNASSRNGHPYDQVANGYPVSQQEPLPMRGKQSIYSTRLLFKESPFNEILEPLTQTVGLAVIPQNRQNANLTLPLSQPNVERLRRDLSYRVMLYGAVDSGIGPYARSEVAFPHQIEVKVNGDEVKANYKGLKNKPGSVRPVDITDFIRKAPEYANQISVTYALTTKKYFLLAQLLRKHSVDELTAQISKSRAIKAETVVREMISKANDPDIVATSIVMSLKDPISTLRIRIPCRSTVCTHNQCFDAAYFLELQEQAPTWMCPVCSKVVSYESLAVDQYVKNILDTVPSSVDQVTIEPNGTWSQGITESENVKGSARKSNRYGNGYGNDSDADDDSDDDSDDDIVEIFDNRITAIKSENSTDNFNLARTPPLSSRETSTTTGSATRPPNHHSKPQPQPPSSTSKKRTHDVIDLTLSDSDTGTAPPPAKRPAYSTPNSLPDSSLSRNGSVGVGNGGGIRMPPHPPHPRHHPAPLPRSASTSNINNHNNRSNHTNHATPPTSHLSNPNHPTPATRPNTVMPFRMNPYASLPAYTVPASSPGGYHGQRTVSSSAAVGSIPNHNSHNTSNGNGNGNGNLHTGLCPPLTPLPTSKGLSMPGHQYQNASASANSRQRPSGIAPLPPEMLPMSAPATSRYVNGAAAGVGRGMAGPGYGSSSP